MLLYIESDDSYFHLRDFNINHNIKPMAKSRVVKRKSGYNSLGQPAQDDKPGVQLAAEYTSSAPCTRHLPVRKIPSLLTVCIRVFTINFVEMSFNDKKWEVVQYYLKLLPDHIVVKVFAQLRMTIPTFLKHEIITMVCTTLKSVPCFLFTHYQYFLRGTSIILTDVLSGVNRMTIRDIPRLNSEVQELELSGFGSISDKDFATAINSLKKLRVLVLR